MKKKMSAKKSLLVRTIVMLVIAGLVVVLAFSLRPSNEETKSTFEIDYDMTVWYYDDALTPYLTDAADPFFKESGLRVDFELVSSLEFLDKINQANVNDEDAPDAYIIDSSKLESAYLSSLAKPNDNENYIYANFLNKALENATYKGKLVAYPLAYNTSFMVYNTDLIENEPASFKEIAKEIKDGTLESDAFQFDVNNLLYNFFFVGNYVNLGGETGDDANQFDLSSDEYTEALNYMQSLSKRINVDANIVDYTNIERNFMSGTTKIGIFSPSSLLKFSAQEGLNYMICPIPKLNDDLETKTMSQTSLVCVNPDSENVSGAEELAVFLTDDYAENIYETSGLMSCKTSEKNDIYINIIQEIYEDSASLPKLIETESLWENLNTMLTSVWEGTDVEKAQSKLNVSLYIALSTRTEQEDN